MSRRFVLSNRSCTTVHFSCDIQQPFHVQVTKEKMPAVDTSKGRTTKNTGRAGDRNRFSLKPSANLEVSSSSRL